LGQNVLCIDCDIGLRNLDIPLGMTETPALSFHEVCSGEYPLSGAAQHPIYKKLSFLTAPLNCRPEDIDPDAFGTMLDQARKQFTYVLMDAPAGIDMGFRLCARYADRVILVTGGDPAAVRDAERAGQLLELMGKQNVRLIVNRVSKKLYKAVKVTVDDIMDTAGLPLLGIVPEDGNVVLSASAEKPLLACTGKGAAAACTRIAKRIIGLPVPIPKRQ